MKTGTDWLKQLTDDVTTFTSAWREAQIQDHLGHVFFSKKVRVVIRRPWWLPNAWYRALMRTIIIQEER